MDVCHQEEDRAAKPDRVVLLAQIPSLALVDSVASCSWPQRDGPEKVCCSLFASLKSRPDP